MKARSLLAAALVALLTAPVPLAAAESRERRIDEIAAFLPPKPSALGAHIGERGLWDALASFPEASALVADAAKALGEPIPDCPDELYLEYSRNGVRRNYERPYNLRTRNLAVLLAAECLENKGRFLGRISDYVEAVCAERTWSMPAHDPGLSDFNGKPHVELGSSARAYLIALACSWLGGVLDEDLRRRALGECDRRIFKPYLVTARNPDDRTPGHWWYRSKSNWNSVCNSCVVRAALSAVESRRERAEFVASAEEAVRFSLAGYLDDGYCEEGMGYWNYGWGHYLAMGLAVRAATDGKVDFFADPKCRRVMLYAYGFQLERGHSPLFADTGRVGPRPALLSLQRMVYPDLPAPDSAPSIFDRDALALTFPLFPSVRAAFFAGQGAAIPLPARSWFPDAQVLVARCVPSGGGARVSFAIKGGHNDELHNHNDLGSYELMVDGARMAGDPGGEEYTARTFSKDRYVSKVLNSYGHPVPVVGGCLQGTGRDFGAKVLKTEFSPEKDTFVLDLTRAYKCPSLQSLVRTVNFDRKDGRIGIEDKVAFSAPSAFEVPIVTYLPFEGDGLSGDLVLRHPSGGHDVKIRAEGSAPLAFREEKIHNPNLRTITRLSFAFASPVTNAALRVVFRL